MNIQEKSNELTSYWLKTYQNKHNQRTRVNRNTAFFKWKAILEDFSFDEIKELIDFCLNHMDDKYHDLEQFSYNYDKIADAKDAYEEERERLHRMQVESEKRAKEWKKKIERITSNSRSTDK